MNNNEIKEMNCPFCGGTGTYKMSEIKGERREEKEIIAKFLKRKGFNVIEITQIMGYKPTAKVSIQRFLDRGIGIKD